MSFGEYSNFTIFVLLVSIGLSFTLRKLIQDIQLLKGALLFDLSNFTRDLVEDHPTLEKYRQMAIMCFRHEMYKESLLYFERLLRERVFLREARYYQVICLVRLNKLSEAHEVFNGLDLGAYSYEEVSLMRNSFARQNPLIRWRDVILRLLLTNVHFQYLPQRTNLSTREAEIERVITSLPTRYTHVQLKAEQEHFYVFTGYDQHLERQVRLQVEYPESPLKNFLDYPKILARLDSRFFPEVYDLQQTGLIYYSLELFEGDNLFDVLLAYKRDVRLEDILRLWISILGGLRFLKLNNVFLNQFDLSEIGLHSRKNNLFFSGSLCDYNLLNVKKLEANVRQLLIDNLRDTIEQIDQAEDLEIWLEGVDEINKVSDVNLQMVLEGMYSKLIMMKAADTGRLMEQLGQLEKIHRSCVHGLKGKYSITKRYQDDPKKLQDTFFRKTNIEDVNQKVDRFKKYCEELRLMSKGQEFGVSSDLLALDLNRLIQRQNQLFEQIQQHDSDCTSEAIKFLNQQYDLFSKLSDEQSHFIQQHEVDLILLLEGFRANYIERQISLDYPTVVRASRIRVLSREEFENKIVLILENLANNAFEAGATDLRLSLHLDGNELRLEILDNGPGIAEQTLLDLVDASGYSFEFGGTGLISSRNMCTSIGVGFEAIRIPDGVGSQINLKFAIYEV